MMDLKFRIWNKKEKEWVENVALVPCSSGEWDAIPLTHPEHETQHGIIEAMKGQIDRSNLSEEDKKCTKMFIYGCSYALVNYSDGYLLSGNYEVVQYTGLKSKNNIEVYEGDILEDSNYRKYLIKWRKAGFCMDSLADEDIKTRDYFLAPRPLHECVIVGNKFKNPELLGDVSWDESRDQV